MRRLFRIGTDLQRFRAFAGIALALVLAPPAFAQDQTDEPMDEDQAVAITCDDGTSLSALFGESSVALTFADGKSVELSKQQDDDKGFVYTNGKMSLSGDESQAKWTVGKKTPVACRFDDEPQDQATHFDEPLTVDSTPLPKDTANPDAQPQVNCYRFAGFMVKEVDLGEKGAESLAVSAPDAACERAAGAKDRPVKDDIAGYFFGAKGNLVFFQSADGYNGGVPFVVFDTRTMKRLFDDSFEGSDFESLDVSGTTVKATFRRVFSADCSLYLDPDGTCAARLGKQLGLEGPDAQLPDCKAAYDAEKERTPDYAKEIGEAPSVITYEAELTYNGQTATVRPLKGETVCSVPG